MAKPSLDISVHLFQTDTLHIVFLFTPECSKTCLTMSIQQSKSHRENSKALSKITWLFLMRKLTGGTEGKKLPGGTFWTSSCSDNYCFNAVHTHWKRQLEWIIWSEDVMPVGKDGTAWHWKGMACKTKGPFSRCANVWAHTSTEIWLPDC